MDRRLFDIAQLNAELKAKLAFIKFEEKFVKKEKKNATKTTATQAQAESATNNDAQAQSGYVA